MKRSRFSDEKIIGILKQSEAGASTKDLCREHGISPATFYSWRRKFGGMEVADAQELRRPEEENRRLKEMVADRVVGTLRALESSVRQGMQTIVGRWTSLTTA